MARVSILLLVLGTCLPACMAQSGPTDLTALSLEDFLRVEVVSVSKGAQRLSRSAAAVYVITQEEIRRSGARTLPDALRLAPGVHAARINGTTWAVGIRGFNGFYSNKLLVMIDGRTVYNPTTSGVFWSRHQVVLEDIDRIEVIRGPAGAMWGANAVNGVINILTKHASEVQGAFVSADVGTLDHGRTTLRYGARAGDQAGWRTWFQHNANGQAVLPPDSPELGHWISLRGGVRADWTLSDSDDIMLESEVQQTRADIHVYRFPAVGQRILSRGDGGGLGGFLLGRWRHTSRRADETVLQVFQDNQNTEHGLFGLNVRTFDADLHHSWKLPTGHTLMVGGGFRRNRIQTEGTSDVWFDPPARTYLVSNVFLQNEWQVKPDRLALTFGAKLERYTLAGAAIQPSARIVWTPSLKHSYWMAVSRAVRIPSHSDYAHRFPMRQYNGQNLPFTMLVSGDSGLKPESVRAFDAGARWQAGRKTGIELAAFTYDYSNIDGYGSPFPLDPAGFAQALRPVGPPGAALQPFQPTTIPITIQNLYNGANRGLEITLRQDLRRNLRLAGSYSWLSEEQRLAAGIDPARSIRIPYISPRHSGQLRLSWDLSRRWSVESAVFQYSGMRSKTDSLQATTRVDTRISRKIGESSEIYLSGHNLLYGSRREFISDWAYPAQDIGRSIHVGFSWQLR